LTVSNSALGGTGTVVIPLVPGANAFVPTAAQPTMSPLGPVNGTSFLSADGTFFYANLTPVNAPTQREFIAGGLPVSASALAATGSTRIVAFTVQPDAALQSNIPFVRNNAGGNLANAYISPLYLVAPPNTAIGDATTVSAARTLQASLAITGQGANQQSVLVTAIGSVAALQSSGAPVISGVVRGTSQLSATSAPVRIGSGLTSVVDGNGNSLYGANAISGFVLDQTQYNSTATGSGVLTTPVIPSTASEVPLSGAATNYGFNQPATATNLPAGVGTSRTSQTLTGYFGGLMNTTAQTQPYAITGTTSLSTDATNNRIAATLTSDPLSSAATSGVTSIKMQFGGLTGDAGGREAFIDDNTYGVAESVTQPQQINGQNLVVDGDTTQAGKLYLLSSGAAPPPTSLLPAGASYCQCQYLQWGYWGGDLRTGDATDSNISRIDRGAINFWVAGKLTPVGDISTLAMQGATGNYSGHLIGTVFNNGAQYVAAGGLSATYTFATQMGSFSVNNYDGQSFTVSGKATTAAGGTQYSVPIKAITQQGVPIAGGINGSFYGPMAANTGGNFAFHTVAGPTYLTSGIFAAAKH
jgi:trimeric autotransporter adhesin